MSNYLNIVQILDKNGKLSNRFNFTNKAIHQVLSATTIFLKEGRGRGGGGGGGGRQAGSYYI